MTLSETTSFTDQEHALEHLESLIEEGYDSIAVGKIIKNENTCIKLLPGDLLKLNK